MATHILAWILCILRVTYSQYRFFCIDCTEFRETTGSRLRDPASVRVGEFMQPLALSFAELCITGYKLQ